ncbi:hypothetical protein Tco_0624437 [Tanacetum coccineum]|uniref:Transposase (putative) gypsy type domain-containing protein n=1 Tax=Tanacetum coccineum TaxID=301880 RepID=A0ABQ4WDW8_9ASTR
MANKHSIMTREMVESFCNNYYIPDEVHPTSLRQDRTITQFPEGKVGVYTRLFDYCGYRIPLTKFFVAVLKHFRIHISQLSPFGAARVSHFEVLMRVLDLAPSVAVFRAFYTRIYSDGLFSFAKRSYRGSSLVLSKPPDSIKNWADHFFWVDSRVFPIFVPLYIGSVLEKDPAPHLTAHQEQAVQVLSSNKAHFRRYPECFLVLVGLSPYYPFDENTYPAFERPDKMDMSLLDYIRTADPRKVQAVEVQKGEEQVKLLDSIKHCFMSLNAPAMGQQEGGSGSGTGPEVSAPSVEENVVAEENIIPVGTYLDLMDSEGDLTMVEKGDAARKHLLPEMNFSGSSLYWAFFTGGHLHTGPELADAPVYIVVNLLLQQGTVALNSEDDKRWYIPRWNITNDSLLDDIYLGSEVRSRTEHELELKRSFVLTRVSALKSAVSRRILTSPVLISALRTLVALDDSPCSLYEAKNLISALTSERDGLASESPEYQGILGHALGRAVDFEANYLDAVKALEEADFPLVHLLKSKKDSGMDEILDYFLLGGPLTDLPEAAYLQPCLEQLSIPIYYADVKAVVEETSLSFSLLNVHTRAEELAGEASTSEASPLQLRKLSTDEGLGKRWFEGLHLNTSFEMLPRPQLACNTSYHSELNFEVAPTFIIRGNIFVEHGSLHARLNN